MSVRFWGRTLNPGETYSMQTAGILELRQVSLPETPEKGKTIIKIIAKGHAFTLCTLDRDLVECQSLRHTLIAEDKATLVVQGVNPVHFTGSMIVDIDDSSSEDDMDYTPTETNQDQDMDDSDEDEERETITGQPRYANYLSDLLGPDLPDDDDDDYEDMDDDDEADSFGTMAFRDPTDNEFLGGFELRHFNLAPNIPGYEVVDLRKQEKDAEDTLLQQVFY
ncbi:hypothetical protein MUCCIDRAFT_157928 [Mucor lusitanicus CBS 277.49]|uniref:Nucleoplasmin-like domain-containing protein n=1 Tax=Mucor lusitanicus CBS 277.49 TaxID=747725 RepID=A0A168PFH2_MUCCL|nr:hypothetical protein MUCCIDRAFT_157928 [Mucor lusitanicus CBS 277.49]